jgi:hypothetical protein
MCNIPATASEAPENPRACWQSWSPVKNGAELAVTIHTQEVTGSSPVAPTIPKCLRGGASLYSDFTIAGVRRLARRGGVGVVEKTGAKYF